MLDLVSNRPLGRNFESVTRRDFLKIGTLGLGGLTLSDLFRARAAAAETGAPTRKTSVILLFLFGGASQKETFDPKPEAAAEHRCLFDSTATTLPGIRFCSLLPRMARLTDKLAVVRSFAHDDSGHSGGAHWVKTGYPYPPQFRNKGSTPPQTHPSIGSIVARCRGATDSHTGVPSYILFDNPILQGTPVHDHAAWLGQAYGPLVCAERPKGIMNDLAVRVSPERLEDRRTLLGQFDQLGRALDQSGTMRGMDSFQQQAINMLQGGRVKKALDLTREPEALRQRYGPDLGQQLLLGRRLCEAGVGYVTLSSMGWDHHEDIIPGCRKVCPPLDQAVAAFIEDVHQRGLSDEILLVITGEFGRTPYLKGTGRDHWPGINNIVFAGGGLKMGQVIGESDRRGGAPRSRPIAPLDLMATIFHVLGIDQQVQFIHPNGRPISMVEDGKVIEELL
jgi:Protein of unknown function (DUF1501)